MKLNEYQRLAKRTAIYPKDAGLTYTILGLAGEAGEIAGKLSKIIRDNSGFVDTENKNAIADELGDVFWFLTLTADELGFTLEDIAVRNLEKLSDRQLRNVITGNGDKR